MPSLVFRIIFDFLTGLIVPGSDNKLEKFLWRVLHCNEMTACLRVCTLWREIFSAPMRYLSGKTDTLAQWSIVSNSDVLDLAYDAMVAIAADGHALLHPSLDPFAPIAEAQPAFKSWREHRAQQVVKAPDGTPHCVYPAVLEEARSPVGKGNAQVVARIATLAVPSLSSSPLPPRRCPPPCWPA